MHARHRTLHKRSRDFEQGQREILERIAQGAPLAELLNSIVRLIEARDPRMSCSIVLYDPDNGTIHHGAAPSLPPLFVQGIDGSKVGPDEGSCGAAIFRRQRVIVEDIDNHPSWSKYRHLAVPYGFRACWSSPVLSAEGEVVASFAIYYREVRGPRPRELVWVDEMTHLVSIAIGRTLMEDAVRSQQHLRSLAINSVSDVLFDVNRGLDGEYRFASVNTAFLKSTGLGENQVVAQRVRDVIPQPSLDRVLAAYDQAISERRAVSWLEATPFPTGLRYGEVSITPVFDESGRFTNLVGAVRDVTEHKQAEERIQAQARLLDLAKDAILSRTVEGVITYWNGGAERVYGFSREEAVGHDVTQLIYTDRAEYDRAQAALLEFGEYTGELSQVTKSGRSLVVEASWTLLRDDQGKPEGVLAINTDVTHKKQLEIELQRSRRMESLGTFAGGIAHDFNNILLAVSANATHALEQAAPSTELHVALSEIMEAASRATDLVRQIMTFSRQRQPKREIVVVEPVVREALRLVRSTFPASIRLEIECSADLPAVWADPTQLHQVVMNLATNAAQAMPDGGALNVRLDHVAIGVKASSDLPLLAPGAYVRLTVSDTGSGMDESTMQRIFDPFFTTRSQRGGTGLGLSVVDGIVKTHGGWISVESKPQAGAVFAVYLPAAPKSADA